MLHSILYYSLSRKCANCLTVNKQSTQDFVIAFSVDYLSIIFHKYVSALYAAVSATGTTCKRVSRFEYKPILYMLMLCALVMTLYRPCELHQ
jgi:formate hydrogenlyase subunit 3/multisubunit Na+/H+ antiporter MnhD subunit